MNDLKDQGQRSCEKWYGQYQFELTQPEHKLVHRGDLLLQTDNGIAVVVDTPFTDG